MRYLWILMFAAVLAAPFALRRAIAPREATSTAARGAAAKLVIITPHNQDIRNEYSRAFSTWHLARYGSAVELDFRIPGGASDVKRQLEATYQPYRDADGKLSADLPEDISVVWGGGDYFFDSELKPLGILLPIRMSPSLDQQFHAAFPGPALAGVKLYDSTAATDGTPTPQWIGVCLSSFGICYNPDVYSALHMPVPSPDHGWNDLADPRLAGLLALADPAHSGSSAVAFQMVIQHEMALAEAAFLSSHPQLKAGPKGKLSQNPEYRAALAAGWKRGMSELLKIAANARYFTDSSTLVPLDVSRGEAAAGMAIDFYARVTQESVGPQRIGYIAPTGATAITPDPVAILLGTRGARLELSQHFLEFLLSPEGQRLWILRPGQPGGPHGRSLRRMPIRRDLYGDRSGWADDFDPFQTAGGFNQRGEWMVLFGDTRPLWVAAWIDSRDALKDTYGKILAVPDPQRRAGLIDELADLPVAMSDVEALRTQRKQIEAAGAPLAEWRANQQIDWAKKFREHYRQVAKHAE